MAYDQLADQTTLTKTTKALTTKGYQVSVAKKGSAVLDLIKKIIPKRASIMNGSSVTLEQIGFVEYLKSNKHPWNNLHAAIVAQKDPDKQAKLRKQAILSDFYLGSVHALTQAGEFIIASNTGSQLPHIVYSSANLIFVISTKKIVPTIQDGIRRLEEYVMPLEEKHMQELYNIHTAENKIVIFKGESSFSQRKIHIILVEEDLGF